MSICTFFGHRLCPATLEAELRSVLRDLIESDCVPTVSLTQIFRQAAKSLIVTNAHAIVNGQMPELSKKDNDFFSS